MMDESPADANSTTTYKVVHKESQHIRKFTLAGAENTLEGLLERVRQLFRAKAGEFALKYEDADGDLVTITEPQELRMAAEESREQGVVRLLFAPSEAVHSGVFRAPRHSHRRSALHNPFVAPPSASPSPMPSSFESPRVHPYAPQSSSSSSSNSNSRHPAGEYSAVCNASNQRLRIGDELGWMHMPGTTRDLCKAAWEALGEEKAFFVVVDSPADLGEERARYRTRHPAHAGNARQGDSDRQNSASNSDEGSERDSDEMSDGFIEASAMAGAMANSQADEEFAAMVSQQTAARPEGSVLAGPSIPAGSKIGAGSRVLVIWEVANTGEALWVDVQVQCVGSNPLKLDDEGTQVPMLTPGASGLVCCEVVVPEACEDTRVLAQFRLADSNGRQFGPALGVDFDVCEPSKATSSNGGAAAQGANQPQGEVEDALLDALRGMGFSAGGVDEYRQRLQARTHSILAPAALVGGAQHQSSPN